MQFFGLGGSAWWRNRSARTFQRKADRVGRPRLGSPTAVAYSPAAGPQITRSRPAAAPTGRPKVAVLAWDVGHNPLGRAIVLAEVLQRRFDVEIWGAQFERYGAAVWPPLADAGVRVNSFPGLAFPEHLDVMQQVAEQIDADAIYVSKPRLPSYLLGVLAKEARNRPLVLDVDDHELAFFGEDTGLDLRALSRRWRRLDLSLPFERAWTRACDPLIGAADQVTVSNVALQQRYGGMLIPHARDERVFDPALYDREETRRSLGVTASDRLLLFGGTPRAHKGVVDVLRAIDEIGDDRYRLMVFGTRELDDLRTAIGSLERWLLPLRYQSFEDLPRLVGAADLACVLQDPTHPVSRYQMPAKITDALAMAVPCLVSAVPPLRPLVDAGVVQVLEPGDALSKRIERVFDDHDGGYDEALDRAKRGRELYLEEYSYEAVSDVAASMFDTLLESPPPLAPALGDLSAAVRRTFAPPEGADESSSMGPRWPARVPGRPGRVIPPGGEFDLVIFWRQNDSGIYGRRQDMFLKYLHQSGRVHSIVHFDNPTTPELLVRMYRRGAGSKADQSRLVVAQTVRRVTGRRNSERVHHHTFLFGGRWSRKAGLPRRDRYVKYIRYVLKRRKIGTRPTVFWVYPSNFDLPLIIDALKPDLVVADVVDDNRTWFEPNSARHAQIERNYEEVVARSDVVIANCEPVAASMRRFAPEVHVVPNGLEMPDGRPPGPRPAELQGLAGPIIGYVGNLSARLDHALLETIVRARRDWQFVFVGSAHLDNAVLELAAEPNVRFVGVKPYEEALRFIRHFDVALIPHVDSVMTRSMNPLKAFVYCSAGVPVVATPIGNLGEMADLITIAEGPERFIEAIEAELLLGHRPPDLDALRNQSWESRVAQALALIDEAWTGASVD